jgi:hypothetical protein
VLGRDTHIFGWALTAYDVRFMVLASLGVNTVIRVQIVVRIQPETGMRHPRQRASHTRFGLFAFALRVVRII